MKPVIIIAIAVVCSVVIFSNLSDAEAKTWKVYVSEMPKHWESQFGNLYYEGTKYWEKRVPGTYFTEITHREKADFVVQWSSQFQGTKLGYYTSSTNNDFGRPFIAITLGFMDDESVKWQDRKFNLVDAEYAKLITIHELGHAIGYGHSDDPDDIMYTTIYDYDNWLFAKQFGDLETNQKFSVNVAKLQNTQQDKEQKEREAQQIQLKNEVQILQSQSYYKLEQLKEGVNVAEDALKKLSSNTSGQKETIDQAWDLLKINQKKLNDITDRYQKGDRQLGSQYYENAKSWYSFSEVDSQQVGDNLKEISKSIEKVQKMQKQTCFLFWCW